MDPPARARVGESLGRIALSTRAVIPLATLLACGACISPSVLEPADREVRLALAEVVFEPARLEDVPGRWVSVELSGPLAAVVEMIVYQVADDGTYTGAALVAHVPPRFEVVSGTWSFADGLVRLDDAPPATAEVAADLLRLSGDDGVVVLRREVRR